MRRKFEVFGVVLLLALSLLTVNLEASALAAKPAPPIIQVQVHGSNYGWQGARRGSSVGAGTTGQSLRMEAIAIALEGDNAGSACDLEYRAHVAGVGWQTWRKGGDIAGTTGQSRAIEAIEIRVAERKPPNLDIWLKNGIGNVGYYIDNSAVEFTGRINGAVNNWMYTGWANPLYMNRMSHN